jgi:hypothetical protein
MDLEAMLRDAALLGLAAWRVCGSFGPIRRVTLVAARWNSPLAVGCPGS